MNPNNNNNNDNNNNNNNYMNIIKLTLLPPPIQQALLLEGRGETWIRKQTTDTQQAYYLQILIYLKHRKKKTIE